MAELNINVLPPVQREIWPKLGDVTGRFVKETGLTLVDGIAAAAIYGESFVPITSLKALSYMSDLAAELPDADLAVLHKAVTEVALDKLPVTEPLGAIGDYAAAGDGAAWRPL